MAVTTVADLMSREVETLRVGETLDLARDIMALGRIRHLPVVDAQGHLVGLVTHRMLLGAWVSHGDPSHENAVEVARDVPVEMLMQKNVETVASTTPAAIAARQLEQHRYGCLPVVDDGRLVGILTEADFVQFARQFFERQT